MSAQQRSDPSLPSPVASKSDNPFAVSHVGLGAQPYLEPQPGVVASTAQRLEQSGWRGQIVGPHGSGKTTLTIALARSLCTRFEYFSWLVVRPLAWFGSRVRNRAQLVARQVSSEQGVSLDFVAFQLDEPGGLLLPRLQGLKPEELCFVDGIELLPKWRQRQLLQASSGRAVVFTTHRRVNLSLSVLAELQPDLLTFRRLVAQLQAGVPGCLESEAVDRAFQSAQGDFRQGLSLLYDKWESRRRAELKG